MCGDKRLALLRPSSEPPPFHVMWTVHLQDLEDVKLTPDRYFQPSLSEEVNERTTL